LLLALISDLLLGNLDGIMELVELVLSSDNFSKVALAQSRDFFEIFFISVLVF